MPERKLKPKQPTSQAIVKPSSNKTRDFIKGFGPNHPGNQGFWGEALNDIPDPREEGKFLTHNQFKDYLKSPEFLAKPEYNDEAKRSAYGQQVFKDAQTRFYQRADSNPDKLVFPGSAVDALNKPVDEFMEKTGGFSSPENGKVVDEHTQQDRFKILKEGGVASLNKTYAKGTQAIKVKDKNRGKVKSKMQKAANGLNDVAVPEAGNYGNVLTSGLSMASTGAEIGGPWGAAIGGVLGVGEGLLQKSKQDEAHAAGVRINQDNKINREFAGVDPTINQKMQTYKMGTKSIKKKRSKLIEAEDKEHVFDDQLNHKGIVNGKTHKEGGEVIAVEEGDSIFPAKHKATIDEHLKTGNKQAIKKIRSKLPKDTDRKGRAELGAGDIDIPDPVAYAKRNRTIKPVYEGGSPLYADNKNRNGRYGAYHQAVAGLDTGTSNYLNRGDKGNPYPYSVIKDSNGTMYKHNMDYSPLTPRGIDNPLPTTPAITAPDKLTGLDSSSVIGQSADSPTSSITSPDGKGFNANGALKYANIANNLIQSLQTPKSIEQNYLDPDLLKYQDRSETLRRDSRGNQSIQTSNARNTSGGMAGNIRANQAAAGTQNLENQDSINEREMARADQIDNTNVEIKNKAKEINLGRKDYYNDQLLRQRAVQDQFRNAGIQELASQAEVNERDNYARSRDLKEDEKDQQTLNLLNQTTRFRIDPSKLNTENSVEFNPNSQTTETGSSGNKITTTKSIDTKGRESSKTTTTNESPKDSVNSLFGRSLKKSRKLR